MSSYRAEDSDIQRKKVSISGIKAVGLGLINSLSRKSQRSSKYLGLLYLIYEACLKNSSCR